MPQGTGVSGLHDMHHTAEVTARGEVPDPAAQQSHLDVVHLDVLRTGPLEPWERSSHRPGQVPSQNEVARAPLNEPLEHRPPGRSVRPAHDIGATEVE